MRLFSFLLLLLFSLSVFASADLYELERIVQSEMGAPNKMMITSPDVPGSSTVSKSASMQEVLNSIEKCKNNETLKTTQDQGEDFKTISFSCKVSENEIIVSESLIQEENKIASFQEITFEEKMISPREYLNLLERSETEKVSTKDNSSGGLRTLGTFARVGIPVILAFKTSKILAPDRLDWQKHFIAGAIIGGVTVLTTQGILRLMAKKKGWRLSETKITVISSIAGLLVSVLAGGGKEFWDSRNNGTVEFRDAMFTAAGGSLVSIFFAIPFGRIFGWRPAPQTVMVPYRGGECVY